MSGLGASYIRDLTVDITQDIPTDAPDWLLIIATTAACWHAGARTGIISISHVTFANEPMVSLCRSDCPVSWIQQSTSLSKTRRKTRTQPLKLQRLTLDASVNITLDQRWWFQFSCLCANMRRWQRLSRVSLGQLSECPERYPTAIKRLWTKRT